MPRPKKRNKRTSTTRTAPSDGVQGLQQPKTRLGALLQLFVDVPKTAEEQLWTIEIPEHEGQRHLVMFDASVSCVAATV